MGLNRKKQQNLARSLWLTCLFLASSCNWLNQGTGKLGIVRSYQSFSKPTYTSIQAGAIAIGEGITSELSTNLIGAGLSPSEAQIVADSSQTEIVAAAGQISIQTLSLSETNPLTFVAGPAVRGAIKALDEPGVNLTKPSSRAAIAQVVMSSTVGSLGGRTSGLSTNQVLSLQKEMVGTGVKSLNDASLGGEQAANAIKALTTGAAASLAKSVDSNSAAAAAASIVSGAVESITAAGISTDLIQSVVGSAVEGVIAQLSKTGVQDTSEAASLVAKSSVQSLKVLALSVEKIIEATEGAAKGAVSALTAAGISKEGIGAVAQKVASSSVAALKTAGVPDESVGKAAGAIASGAIQGLGAAGLSAAEIAATKSVSAIVSGASSGVAASGVAADKISSALGDVAGTAITSIAQLAKISSMDVTSLKATVVSEVIQSTIAQAIAVGVASSGNISSITATIATGAGQGLASLANAGLTVSNVQTVIQQATVTVLTEQQIKINIDSSTIASVATSTGQTAEATKTAEVAKTSGTALSKCATTYPNAWTDSQLKGVIEPMATLPSCERDPADACPKKRFYPETTATWIALPNSNICQFTLQKLSTIALPNSVLPCPAQLLGPIGLSPITEIFTGDRSVYACSISQGSCPPASFDATILSPPLTGAQTCLYTRRLELANSILFFPSGGSYSSPQEFWISAPKGAVVYVTNDSTTPSAANGTIYHSQAIVLSSTKTIRAVGILNGTPLPEVSASYIISGNGANPEQFLPAASCTTVAISQDQDSYISIEKWDLLSPHPDSPSIRACLKGALPVCPDLFQEPGMSGFYGPWVYEAGGSQVCAYQEIAHCSEVFPGKTTLSQSDILGSSFTNDFGDVSCTAPTAEACIPLSPTNSGYSFIDGGEVANGRYFCHYGRNLTACSASVYPDAVTSIISTPLTQTSLASMSPAEKPWSFERACQYSNQYTDDLRFPMVDASLKIQGYFATSSTDSLGRRRVAIYKQAEMCPEYPLSLKDVEQMKFVDNLGKKACEVAITSTCPSVHADVDAKFTLSSEIYSSPDRKRCVFNAKVNMCPLSIDPINPQMTEISDWRENIFLCSITQGSCPSASTGLSIISPSESGPQTCAYAWAAFVPPVQDQSITSFPPPGSYGEGQNVFLYGPNGASIHYTTDGTVPTLASPMFISSIPVMTSTTIKAIAIQNGLSSPLFSATYTIGDAPFSTPPCDSLPLPNGYVEDQAWTSMNIDPAQPSRRRCHVAAGNFCPTLSNTLLERDIRGPLSFTDNTTIQCEYEEPHHCDTIFPGLSTILSAHIVASPYKNEFGDVSCTKLPGESCLPLDQANLSHIFAPGRSLADGRSYCHYTYLNTPCPATMLTAPDGSILTLLSNPITDTIKSQMDPIQGSMEFSHACRPQAPVKYPLVDNTLAANGYYADFHGVPGTSRIVLRHRARLCPYLPQGTSLGLSDLKMMSFVENRGIKACEAPTLAECPSLTGGNASSDYSQTFTSYMIGAPATTRCEYGLITAVNCPADSLSAANLTLIDDVFSPRYVCQKLSGTCPSGEPDLRLISTPSEGAQRCLYEPKPLQSCFAIKSNQPSAQSGLYTIDPDGENGFPPISVFCDMETDGGGWTLVGRGREDWAWDENGKNVGMVTAAVGTPAAFVPAYLPSMTINKILGIDGSNVAMNSLIDGVRIKRAANISGTSYQEVRWMYSSLTHWTWLFTDGNDSGKALSSIVIDGTLFNGPNNTRDTWTGPVNNDQNRIFTFGWDQHQYKVGFSYGATVISGELSNTSFLWQLSNMGHAMPYAEVYVRH